MPRLTEAREQLRIAHSMLEAIGEAFAERARGELQATGETEPSSTGEPSAVPSPTTTVQCLWSRFDELFPGSILSEYTLERFSR